MGNKIIGKTGLRQIRETIEDIADNDELIPDEKFEIIIEGLKGIEDVLADIAVYQWKQYE